jgi:hypothetical protein
MRARGQQTAAGSESGLIEMFPTTGVC